MFNKFNADTFENACSIAKLKKNMKKWGKISTKYFTLCEIFRQQIFCSLATNIKYPIQQYLDCIRIRFDSIRFDFIYRFKLYFNRKKWKTFRFAFFVRFGFDIFSIACTALVFVRVPAFPRYTLKCFQQTLLLSCKAYPFTQFQWNGL